jgi:hypothetical protein
LWRQACHSWPVAAIGCARFLRTFPILAAEASCAARLTCPYRHASNLADELAQDRVPEVAEIVDRDNERAGPPMTLSR